MIKARINEYQIWVRASGTISLSLCTSYSYLQGGRYSYNVRHCSVRNHAEHGRDKTYQTVLCSIVNASRTKVLFCNHCHDLILVLDCNACLENLKYSALVGGLLGIWDKVYNLISVINYFVNFIIIIITNKT